MVFFWTNKQVLVDEVDKLVERVALEVQRDAKRFAPVDRGILQSSITAWREYADTNAVSYLIGTNVYYAAFQEFGTRNIPPHPYLGKALAAVASRYP